MKSRLKKMFLTILTSITKEFSKPFINLKNKANSMQLNLILHASFREKNPPMKVNSLIKNLFPLPT